MGNAYYVFFVPMVIAMRMPMPRVMGMPMTMCTGTYTIGKHAAGTALSKSRFAIFSGKTLLLRENMILTTKLGLT